MQVNLDGSAAALTGSFASATAVPLTLAAAVRPTTLSGSRDLLTLIDVQSAAANAFRLNLDTTNSVRAIQRGSNSQALATSSAGAAAGRLVYAGAVFAANNSRTAYCDGVPGSANTTNLIQNANPAITFIGRYDNTAPNWFHGQVAYAAIWTAALTAAEMAALGSGTPPWMVRPESLAACWSWPAGDLRARDGRWLLARMGNPGWLPDPWVHVAQDGNWPGIAAALDVPPPPPPPPPPPGGARRRWYPGLGRRVA